MKHDFARCTSEFSDRKALYEYERSFHKPFTLKGHINGKHKKKGSQLFKYFSLKKLSVKKMPVEHNGGRLPFLILYLVT